MKKNKKRVPTKFLILIAGLFVGVLVGETITSTDAKNEIQKAFQTPPKPETPGPECVTGGFYYIKEVIGKWTTVHVHLDISRDHGAISYGRNIDLEILTSKLQAKMEKYKIKKIETPKPALPIEVLP